MTGPNDHEQLFWELAEPFMREHRGVTRSTMMGFPCLRVDGAFFASCEPTTGALLVKLSEASVVDLVKASRAEPFAPAGRRFRQWATIPVSCRARWATLLQQAHEHVSSSLAARGRGQ